MAAGLSHVSSVLGRARRLSSRGRSFLYNALHLKNALARTNAELARVREEIERYEGRLRYLRAHTAMSTLSVSVHEPVPIVVTAGRSVMGEAFRQAWRNFVALLSIAL